MSNQLARIVPSVLAVSLVLLSGSALGQAPAAALIATLGDPQAADAQLWQAATELGAATFADAPERQAAVDALLAAAESNEIGLRVNASVALGRLGDPVAEAVLRRGLLHRNALVRQASARGLGRIGTQSAAEALTARLGDPSQAVQAQVVRALGDAGQPIAVGVLEERLRSPQHQVSGVIKEEIVGAFERLGGYAVGSLLRALESNDEGLRRRSALALGQIADPRAAAALTRHLGDRDARVAMAATTALGRLGEPAITPLMEALEATDSAVQQNAMTALVGVGAPAVPPLESVYRTASAQVAQLENERAVAVAAEAAAQAPPPSALAAAPVPGAQLTDAQIKRELTQVRQQVKTLNEQRARAEQLIFYRRAESVFNDRIDAAERALAAGDLGQAPMQSALVLGVAPLVYAPTESSVAPNAPRSAFGYAAPARTIDAIDEDLSHRRKQAHAAILALGGVGTDGAVAVLTEVVQTGMVDEATLAAEALGRTRNPTAVATLSAALKDATFPSSVRANAARGLGRLGAAQATGILVQAATTDPSLNVRDAALEALESLGAATGV